MAHTLMTCNERGYADLYSHLTPAVKCISPGDSGVYTIRLSKNKNIFYVYLHNNSQSIHETQAVDSLNNINI